MDSAVGKTCPFCQFPVKAGDEVQVCSRCGIPHHASCWRENGGCTTFGCRRLALDASSGVPDTTPSRPATALIGVRYAGFWPRYAATLVDSSTSLAVIFVVAVFLGVATAPAILSEDPGYYEGVILGAYFASLVWGLVNRVYLVGTRGQSIGKMALGLKVIKADGSRMTCGRAFWRVMVQGLLGGITHGLAYLSVATHPQHRGWHDRIVGTAVIHVR